MHSATLYLLVPGEVRAARPDSKVHEANMGPTWGRQDPGGPHVGHIWLWTFLSGQSSKLTHWGRVTHVCVAKLTIIGSDNGLSPSRCQAIIWINAGILLIGPLGTILSEILIEIHAFSFKKMHLKFIVWKMAAILSRPQCVKASPMVWVWQVLGRIDNFFRISFIYHLMFMPVLTCCGICIFSALVSTLDVPIFWQGIILL